MIFCREMRMRCLVGLQIGLLASVFTVHVHAQSVLMSVPESLSKKTDLSLVSVPVLAGAVISPAAQSKPALAVGINAMGVDKAPTALARVGATALLEATPSLLLSEKTPVLVSTTLVKSEPPTLDKKNKYESFVLDWIDVRHPEITLKPFQSTQKLPLAGLQNLAKEMSEPAYVSSAISLKPMSLSTAALIQDWEVRFRDVSVRRVLQRWAQDAQYQVIWESARDFPVEMEVVIHGDFRDAVGAVMESLSQTDYPVQALINSALRQVRVVRYLKGQAR